MDGPRLSTLEMVGSAVLSNGFTPKATRQTNTTNESSVHRRGGSLAILPIDAVGKRRCRLLGGLLCSLGRLGLGVNDLQQVACQLDEERALRFSARLPHGCKLLVE